MRLRLPGTLSARIIAGFAVLVVAFGGIAVTAVLTAEKLEQSVRIIRKGYLELALKARDLADKQQGLLNYLKDDLGEEASTRRVETQIRRYRASRGKLLDEVERTVADVQHLLARSDELPVGFKSSLDHTVSRLAAVRALLGETEPAYVDLLAAPPIQRPRPGEAIDATRSDAAAAAHRRLLRAEAKINTQVQQLSHYQREKVADTSRLLEQAAGKMRLLTIWWGIAALTLGILITAWATLTLRPLGRLRDAAQKIAAGDYGERIEERGPPEVADLAHEFNTMGKRIQERERELVRTERLAAVGKMAAVVTHEVRNPLSAIGLNTELLDEELGGLPEAEVAEARALCRAVQAEVDRLTAITEEYLHFARLPQPRLMPEALGPIVRSLAEFEREPLARKGVTLRLELEADLPPVLVDEGQLRQALRNLLRNAGEAMGGRGGLVEVSTRRGERGDTVELRVRDDGPGISEEIRGRLFDAFASTKEGGTGLGLALTLQIIREHGGTIQVDSPPGQGATFIVDLPVARIRAT
jgi:two-component system, NtrC family, sensor kinase